jgi:glycosyltransferase involved in cell wall biosynthesis
MSHLDGMLCPTDHPAVAALKAASSSQETGEHASLACTGDWRRERSGSTIAAAVITRNEERQIGACLDTLAWADEMLVLDAFSTDRTPELALAGGARVEQRPFDDFARQRNAALSHLRADWVLFVDADERVTPELAAEVRAAVDATASDRPSSLPATVGFWVPRRNIVLGRWIRGGGWYPDYQLRLLNLDRARYDESRPVHEVVLLDGPAGNLANWFVHLNYERLGQLLSKQAAYAALEVRTLRQQGVRGRARAILGRPLKEFWRRYVTLRAYRDGWQGCLLCGAVAAYTGLAYYRLWREQGREDAGADAPPTNWQG